MVADPEFPVHEGSDPGVRPSKPRLLGSLHLDWPVYRTAVRLARRPGHGLCVVGLFATMAGKRRPGAKRLHAWSAEPLRAMFTGMEIAPAVLRRHSEWLLEHARDLRREAEAARRRSANRRLEADQARERASQLRLAATNYLSRRMSGEI